MDYPVEKEQKVRIEYTLHQSKASVKMNPVVIENDNSLCGAKENARLSSRKFLNESITNPSRNMILSQNFIAVKNLYDELDFCNLEILKTTFNILQLCLVKNIDVKISKTGNKEILLYRKNNNSFSNILIDEDGDVSYIYIGNAPGQERTMYFPYEKGFDFNKITSLL